MSPKNVGFVEAIKLFFLNYVNFSARSTRSEYWWFFLFDFIVSFVLAFISVLTGMSEKGGISILSTLWSLALLVPRWSVAIRRLHDTGRSGIHILVIFVPIAGPFILLKWLTDPSDGDNMWGFSADSIAMGRGTSSYNPNSNTNKYSPNSFYNGGQQNSYNDPNSFYTGEQQNSYNDPNSLYTGEQQNSYNDPNSFYTGNDQQGFGGNNINNNNNRF